LFLEITSTLIMSGVLVSTVYYQHGGGGNDARKIERIAENAGLVARDGTKIRIHRRTRHNNFTEYAFQMPHGLSSQQFRDKLDRFQDGLNIKRSIIDISLDDLKAIDWRDVKNLPQQIQTLLKRKKKLRKEVEIDYDGMLIFRVYREALTEYLPFDESLIKGLRSWEVPVGVSRSGYVKHDFEKVPHVIVAGATGYGKSSWLKTVITTLIKRKPDHVTFTLIDLKGGLSFGRFRDIKQCETLAKTPEEAVEALEIVQERMNRKLDELFAAGFEDVSEAGDPRRHFIIIDEAADIAGNEKAETIIKDIARRGRAAGYRLVYATQYPTSETVPSQVKRNCVGRLSFVVDSAIASRVVIDEEGAEKLPLLPGRAIYKTVKKTIVQTPHVTNNQIREVIEPHVTIRARKENDNADVNRARGTDRPNTLVIEDA
jgi:DNA segregation ATPase FtsK/SpoIIIE, S-DNA-T family